MHHLLTVYSRYVIKKSAALLMAQKNVDSRYYDRLIAPFKLYMWKQLERRRRVSEGENFSE